MNKLHTKYITLPSIEIDHFISFRKSQSIQKKVCISHRLVNFEYVRLSF